MKLQLTRPLVFFDLETTGTNTYDDRIVEISVLKVAVDGTTRTFTTRVNPGIPIPAEATAVHHITNEMVAGERSFAEIAPSLANFFKGCDIAGFNSNRFDVPMLMMEFGRSGVAFDTTGVNFVDVQTIFHKREPRTLTAAYQFYCGKDLEGAHGAEADIKATYEVLLGQLEKYDDLPTTVSELAAYTSYLPGGMRPVDSSGKLGRNEKGEICFCFSKFKGQPVAKVFHENPGMADWCMKPERNFPKDVISIFKNIISGKQK